MTDPRPAASLLSPRAWSLALAAAALTGLMTAGPAAGQESTDGVRTWDPGRDRPTRKRGQLFGQGVGRHRHPLRRGRLGRGGDLLHAHGGVLHVHRRMRRRVRHPGPGAGGADAAVLRRSFPYLGDRLRIEIVGEAPGTLRIVHGQGGRIRVTGRAVGGVAAAALADDGEGRLVLTSGEALRVIYVVVLPPKVLAVVRVPGRSRPERVGGRQRAATFRWDG